MRTKGRFIGTANQAPGPEDPSIQTIAQEAERLRKIRQAGQEFHRAVDLAWRDLQYALMRGFLRWEKEHPGTLPLILQAIPSRSARASFGRVRKYLQN